MSELVRLTSATKQFSGRQGLSVTALKDVTLSIRRGEFVMVVGPSGSGKSTLLFTVGGMARPTGGTVHFGDTDVYALSPSRRAALRRARLGFIFQTFNLLPYLSCLDNVTVPAVLDGQPRKAGLARGRELLGQIGLAARIAHRPAELSVGERQRVALCRSLINAPDLLLADEPTGNLDHQATLGVLELFKAQNALGLTILMVTHDLNLAEQGTRLIRLEAGSVVEDRPCRHSGVSV